MKAAEQFMPNVVVIMLGTNDDLQSLRVYNGSFVADYKQLIGAFEHLPTHPKIYIADSPPIYNNSTDLSESYLSNTIIPLALDGARAE